MRPTRLELRGFTAFREAVTVDFREADLFALSGPTGAGKSSLIDAMCFALYGSVPRLDRRTVAPVITTGAVEARVRFDFTVGEQAFTAARVVRRLSGGGATTKEARLESGGEVLAGDAEGVTAAVERVLGLGFDQFTKCVVLPQGEFQRFLHDKPSGRQDLLVRLLEMEVYVRMRGEANSRRQVADSSAELTGRRLDELAGATSEALAAAGERITRLAALRDEIDAAQPRLDALAAAQARATAAAEEASARSLLLGGLRVPDGVAELTSTAAELERAASKAAAAADACAAAVDEAEKVRAALGEEAGLQHLRGARQEREQQSARLAKGEPILAHRRDAEGQAEALVRAAATRFQASSAVLEAARRDHAAYALTAALVAGEPCPVCDRPVVAVPDREAPPGLSAAEATLSEAHSALRTAEAALAPARDARVKAEQALDSVLERLGELDAVLADTPDPAEVERHLREIGEADAALVTVRDAERAARGAAREAAQAARAAQQRRDSAWSDFDTARDKVAASRPPAARRDDLAVSWVTLVEWARGEAATLRTVAEGQRDAASTAQQELDALVTALTARCGECGV
ncbi:MAG: SMC family ATPase, partial [Actinomycetota bacterium]|nr:SMC family ATPase [Actinomycetota bacterium]